MAEPATMIRESPFRSPGAVQTRYAALFAGGIRTIQRNNRIQIILDLRLDGCMKTWEPRMSEHQEPGIKETLTMLVPVELVCTVYTEVGFVLRARKWTVANSTGASLTAY